MIDAEPLSPRSPLGEHRPPGRVADVVLRGAAFVGASVVLVILALILVTTTKKAVPAFQAMGWSFITSDTWDVPHAVFGTLAFTFGTLVTSAIALVIGVPVSLGIALFVNELAPRWMRQSITYVIDLLAAVPSVVYGLWGLLVFAPWLNGFYIDVSNWFSGIPVLRTLFSGDPITGRAFMTAGIILAIMIIPIVTAVSRETFATVPQSLKDGAYAMGATRWEMIRGAVLPHSRSGVTAGVLLGFGRAIGETIAVALVIGGSPQVTARLFSPGSALSPAIAVNFGESTGTYQAALLGMGVLLFVVTLVIAMIARVVIARAERRIGADNA